MDKFRDRQEAGQILAQALRRYANLPDTLVFALPRGGVPVAFEIANALHAPLEVFIVRKLGVPGQEELAFGALATGGTIVFNKDVVKSLNIAKTVQEKVIQAEKEELKRREKVYRGNKALPLVTGKTIILVDDGIATGATIRAAIMGLRQMHPANLIVAVPVAASNTCEALSPLVDRLICPLQPTHFYAVGQWYQDFSQTTDEDVRTLLDQANSIKGSAHDRTVH